MCAYIHEMGGRIFRVIEEKHKRVTVEIRYLIKKKKEEI